MYLLLRALLTSLAWRALRAGLGRVPLGVKLAAVTLPLALLMLPVALVSLLAGAPEVAGVALGLALAWMAAARRLRPRPGRRASRPA